MNQEINEKDIQESTEKKIDFLALAKILWNERRLLIKISLLFIVFGLFIAAFTSKEYTATTTIVPATKGKSIGGNLGGLAAIAGIDLGNGSESGILPTLYPLIISSIPFQKELLKTPLTFQSKKNHITYENYYLNHHRPGLLDYIKKYTIGLPKLIINSIKGESNEVKSNINVNQKHIQSVSEKENTLIKRLNTQLSVNINKTDGYVSISVSMPDKLSAAEMALSAQRLLQKYIINFKVQKSSEQFKFIKARYKEKEREFKIVQQELASFKDENQFVNSSLAKIKLMILQTNYDLVFSVYSELAKKMETQQIQIKEDTPVFTVIKPVSVPIEKSKPNRIMIILIWTLLGVAMGVVFVFGKLFFLEYKNLWYKREQVPINIEE